MAARLLALSQEYGLASREMALVAVVTRAGDRPGELPDTRVVPVGMPQDTDFGAYFPRLQSLTGIPMQLASPKFAVPLLNAMGSAPPPTAIRKRGMVLASKPRAAAPPVGADDRLLELAAQMDSDGGLPGKDPEARAIASVLALLAFLQQGHTPTAGVFRSHVARLVSFLRKVSGGLGRERQETVAAVLERARGGDAPAGNWLALMPGAGDWWQEVEAALKTSRV